MKHALWCLAVIAGAVLGGCGPKQADVPMPPIPTPRYLSRDIDPAPTSDRTPAGNPREIAAAEPSEPAAEPAQVAEPVKDSPPDAAPTTPGGKTPDQIAAEVREVVGRLQQQEFDPRSKRPKPAPLDAVAEPAGSIEVTDIRPVETTVIPVPQVPGEKKPPLPAPAEPKSPPVEAPQGAVTLENLTRHYEALAKAHPQDVELARSLRFLHFLSGNDAGSLEAIPGLPPDDQNLWHWMMASMIAARDRVPGMSRADQAAEVLEDLERVQTILKKEAPLELGAVRFCHEISTFGDYQPVEVNRFKSGEQAKLYAELRNFSTDKGDDGLYRVRLNVSLSLERPDGTSVWQSAPPGVEDKCRSPRQDFFLRVHFPIPKEIPAGNYVFRATFEDLAAHKQAGARINVEIVDR